MSLVRTVFQLASRGMMQLCRLLGPALSSAWQAAPEGTPRQPPAAAGSRAAGAPQSQSAVREALGSCTARHWVAVQHGGWQRKKERKKEDALRRGLRKRAGRGGLGPGPSRYQRRVACEQFLAGFPRLPLALQAWACRQMSTSLCQLASQRQTPSEKRSTAEVHCRPPISTSGATHWGKREKRGSAWVDRWQEDSGHMHKLKQAVPALSSRLSKARQASHRMWAGEQLRPTA